MWLAVLAARGHVEARDITDRPVRELPALGVLVKDRDDLALLG